MKFLENTRVFFEKKIQIDEGIGKLLQFVLCYNSRAWPNQLCEITIVIDGLQKKRKKRNTTENEPNK